MAVVVYYPSCVAGAPAADANTYTEDAVWAADGEMVRTAYALRTDDDYGQTRTLLNEVMDQAERYRLVETVSGAVSTIRNKRHPGSRVRVLAQH